MMFEADLPDLDLEGPRTALWWMQACSRSGGAALARHHFGPPRVVSQRGINKFSDNELENDVMKQ